MSVFRRKFLVGIVVLAVAILLTQGAPLPTALGASHRPGALPPPTVAAPVPVPVSPPAATAVTPQPGPGTITGRTLYNGAPVPGIRLVLVGRDASGRGLVCGMATSDLRGGYALYGVSSGEYHVCAYLCDNRPHWQTSWTPLVTMNGGVVQADMQMRRVPPDGPGSLTGRVLWNGSPVSGVRITLATADCHLLPGPDAVSDRNGVYTFNSLKAGTYRAYVGCWKNPTWFNRCTPPVTVGKDRAQAPDMALCMIIEGVSPRIGDRCRLGDLQLSWTPCSAAQTYDVGVMDTTTRQGVFASWDTPATTSVTVPRDKLLAGHSYVCSVRAYNSAKEEIAGTAGCPANRLWTFSVK